MLLLLPGFAEAQQKPGPYSVIPLDASTVTGNGTATTVLNARHVIAGGTLVTANAAGICIDQFTTAGTATGTPATTVCVAQNQPYYLVPSFGPVSVNSTASSVAVGGFGLN